jgi:hypothetical protein
MTESLWGGAILVALLAVALGGLVHGTLGVGFPLIATPIIALATDVKTAILLTLAPTLALNVISILKGGGWRESIGRYWPIAVFTLGGSVAGTELLMVSDPSLFRLVLAGVILFYLATSTAKRNGWHWIRRYPRFAGFGFGSVSGLLVGTVNVAVPALIIYFTELRLAPVALVQVLNLCFLGGKLAQLGTFGVGGYLTQDILLVSIPLTLVAGAGLSVGMAARGRFAADTYRRWLRKGLFVIAVVLVVQFSLGF